MRCWEGLLFKADDVPNEVVKCPLFQSCRPEIRRGLIWAPIHTLLERCPASCSCGRSERRSQGVAHRLDYPGAVGGIARRAVLPFPARLSFPAAGLNSFPAPHVGHPAFEKCCALFTGRVVGRRVTGEAIVRGTPACEERFIRLTLRWSLAPWESARTTSEPSHSESLLGTSRYWDGASPVSSFR